MKRGREITYFRPVKQERLAVRKHIVSVSDNGDSFNESRVVI